MDFHVFAGNVDLIWDEPDWAVARQQHYSRGSSSTTGAEAVHRRVTFPLRPSKPRATDLLAVLDGSVARRLCWGAGASWRPGGEPDLLPADGPSAQKSDVTQARLQLTRPQILAFRRQVGSLDQRMTPGRRSLRVAAWAGLQDSAPSRAPVDPCARGGFPAVHLGGLVPRPALVGPRFSVHVVAARDLAVFSLGRLPDGAPPDGSRKTWPPVFSHCSVGRGRLTARRERWREPQPAPLRRADRDGRHPLGGSPGAGRLTVPPPQVDRARLVCSRRYLHVFGPATPTAFARWAGIGPRDGVSAFRALGTSPHGGANADRGRLDPLRDEPAFRAALGPAAPARLLPSGDAYFLLQGADRELLVPDAVRRGAGQWDRACLARRGPRRRRGGRHVAAGGRNGDGAALAPTLPRGAPSGRIGGSLTAAGCAGSDRRPLGRRRPPRCFVVNAGSTRSRGPALRLSRADLLGEVRKRLPSRRRPGRASQAGSTRPRPPLPRAVGRT